jgi:hypothetical protein
MTKRLYVYKAHDPLISAPSILCNYDRILRLLQILPSALNGVCIQTVRVGNNMSTYVILVPESWLQKEIEARKAAGFPRLIGGM